MQKQLAFPLLTCRRGKRRRDRSASKQRQQQAKTSRQQRRPKRAASRQRPGGRTPRSSGRRRRPRTGAGQKRACSLSRRESEVECLAEGRAGGRRKGGCESRVIVKREGALSCSCLLCLWALVLTTRFSSLPFLRPPFSSSTLFPKTTLRNGFLPPCRSPAHGTSLAVVEGEAEMRREVSRRGEEGE